MCWLAQSLFGTWTSADRRTVPLNLPRVASSVDEPVQREGENKEGGRKEVGRKEGGRRKEGGMEVIEEGGRGTEERRITTLFTNTT